MLFYRSRGCGYANIHFLNSHLQLLKQVYAIEFIISLPDDVTILQMLQFKPCY